MILLRGNNQEYKAFQIGKYNNIVFFASNRQTFHFCLNTKTRLTEPEVSSHRSSEQAGNQKSHPDGLLELKFLT